MGHPGSVRRTVVWVVDAEGNKGKTSFCRHMCLKHPARICLVQGGKRADICQFLRTWIDQKGLPDTILIDVPRSSLKYIQYGTIENLKDGQVFAPKYESTMLWLNYPKVIVFANQDPALGDAQDGLSLDRWCIMQLDDGVNDFRLTRITAEGAQEDWGHDSIYAGSN